MSTPLRVLIVEDSQDDAELLARALRRGGYEERIVRVDSREAMAAALERESWDLVLCDHHLPGFDSFSALALLHERRLDIPFVIVSGSMGEDLAVAALKAGAHDYLVKGSLGRLIPVVQRELREGELRRERTRLEAALRESERLKAAVLDASLDGVVSIDAGGRILEFNPAAERILGYRRADVLGKPMADLIIPPGLRERFGLGLARHLAGGEAGILARRIEWPALRADGTTFPCEVVVTRIERPPGPMFTGFLRDVTDQRRMAESLIERTHVAGLTAAIGLTLTGGHSLRDTLQSCAATIVEAFPASRVGIWTLAPAPGELELQARAGDDLPLGDGHTRIAVGKGPVGRIAGERQALLCGDVRCDPRFSEHLGAPGEGTACFLGHPLMVGEEMVGVLALFAPLPPGEALAAGLGAIARAIALGIKRKLVEESRTGLERQLLQAQKMEAVGRLAGGIAHDFNNLLAVITGFSELTLAALLPLDPLRRHLEEIHRAGERAAGLTRQLLAFSRRQVLQPRVLDVNVVIEEMDRILRRVIGEDVQFESRLQRGIGSVKADPGQLEQVLMNLVINARDAMPRGGRLTIETAEVDLDLEIHGERRPVERNGPQVMIAVSDTGCGMAPEIQAQIFEPFFTTKDPGKGTGLGLSTVYGIVKQSGGDVWVYSEPGQGTTFKIYLPRVEEPAEPARRVKAAEAPRRGVETILLVEDNDAVRGITLEVLRLQGYIVLEARDGGEALLIGERHPGPIHLVLTDVVMPLMGGRELVERLTLPRPDMRPIFFSGYTGEAVESQGALQSGVPFLQKPFAIDALARLVREVLDAPAVA